MSSDEPTSGTRRPYTDGQLVWALDRLAMGFESADPHIRHEAKTVAKQNVRDIVEAIEGYD